MRRPRLTATLPSRQTCGSGYRGPAHPAAAAAPGPPLRAARPHLQQQAALQLTGTQMLLPGMLGLQLARCRLHRCRGSAPRTGLQAALPRQHAAQARRQPSLQGAPDSRPSSFCLTRSSVRSASRLPRPAGSSVASSSRPSSWRGCGCAACQGAPRLAASSGAWWWRRPATWRTEGRAQTPAQWVSGVSSAARHASQGQEMQAGQSGAAGGVAAACHQPDMHACRAGLHDGEQGLRVGAHHVQHLLAAALQRALGACTMKSGSAGACCRQPGCMIALAVAAAGRTDAYWAVQRKISTLPVDMDAGPPP